MAAAVAAAAVFFVISQRLREGLRGSRRAELSAGFSIIDNS